MKKGKYTVNEYKNEVDCFYVADYEGFYHDNYISKQEATLICQSFNVFNETGLTPRELLNKLNQ